MHHVNDSNAGEPVHSPPQEPRLKATRRTADLRTPQPEFQPNAAPMPPARMAPLSLLSLQPALVQPPLSRTEKVVLRLLLKGMTERRAADHLGRSHNTVHVHIRNIYRKLGVNSRKMLFQLVDSNPQIIADDEPRNIAA